MHKQVGDVHQARILEIGFKGCGQHTVQKDGSTIDHYHYVVLYLEEYRRTYKWAMLKTKRLLT